MALISNIGLPTAEALTVEANYKEPNSNKDPSPDNDEVKTILIGDLCVFEKTMVHHRGVLGNKRKYTWRPSYNTQRCA